MIKKFLILFLLSLLLVQTTNAALVDQSVGYFSLDISTSMAGIWKDLANVYNATPTNTPANVTGKVGDNALWFNKVGGSTNFLTTHDDDSMLTSFTHAFWIKPYGSGGILEKDDTVNREFYYTMDTSTGQIFSGWWHGAWSNLYTGAGTVPTNTWTHIVYVHNTTHSCVYVNAGTPTCQADAWSLTNTAVAIQIGGRSGDAANVTMDEVGFWAIPLNTSAVSSLYNGGAGYNPFTPVTTYFSITGANKQNLAAINVFNATIANVQYTTTNGTINTPYPANGTKYNITVSGQCYSGFCNFTTETYLNFNTSNNLQANLTYWYNATLRQSSPVFESAYQTLQIQINHSNYSFNHYIADVSSALVWNGTTYTATEYSFENYTIFNVTFLTPSLTQTLNISYYWTTNLSRSNGVTTQTINFNLSNIQNIQTISIDNCSTYTTRAIDFYLRSESNDSLIIGTLAGYFETWISSESSYRAFNLSWGQRSNFSICINPPEANYSFFGQAQYGASGYNTETYYFTDAQLDNLTNTINLYLTPSASAVTFTVKDENDNPVPDVYITVQKYDITTNTATTTEIIKTSDPFGEALGQIALNTQRYKFILVYNGDVVLETDSFILTGTSYSFRIILGQDYFVDFNSFLNVDCYTSFNNNSKMFNFRFIDTSGETAQGCLYVDKISGTNNLRVNQTCVSGSSGEMSLYIRNDSSIAHWIGSSVIFINNKAYSCGNYTSYSQNTRGREFGTNGLFYAFMLILVFVMLGTPSAILSVVFMFVGILGAYLLGLLQLTMGSVFLLFMAFMLAGWKISKRGLG